MKRPRLPRLFSRALRGLIALPILAAVSDATWSIVVVDTATGEVGVATATCIPDFNIQSAVPVIAVGKGAAAAQSAVSYTNKLRIQNGFQAGDTPAEILATLESLDFFHQSRQYGIVDLWNPSVSFTGTQAGAAKHDLTGTIGTIKYSIQGNVLTGDAVVFAAETALINTPGDLGQKVMAAMEAARALGGDGRCSCLTGGPTTCGVPPPGFTKSADCASIQIARFGDPEIGCLTGIGCAIGTYYLDLNVIGAFSDPDPVFTLQSMYDSWRLGMAGRPDGVYSSASASAARLPADGLTSLTVTVDLADIDGIPITAGGATLTIAPPEGAAAITSVSAVTDHGDGTYSFDVIAGTTTGTETLAIAVDDGGAAPPATLYPFLSIELDPAASFHAGYDAVSVSAGENVPFTVDLGGSLAGATYLVLASGSGTAPGFPLPGGALLPLNPDGYTTYTLVHPNTPLLPGTAGLLDASGRVLAGFDLPPGVLASEVGLRLDWAALTIAPSFAATVADGFDLVP